MLPFPIFTDLGARDCRILFLTKEVRSQRRFEGRLVRSADGADATMGLLGVLSPTLRIDCLSMRLGFLCRCYLEPSALILPRHVELFH